MSYYGHYEFFEQKMTSHGKICAIDKINPSLYQIKHVDGRVIKVFICECYSFDVAEYIEVCQKLGDVNAVIINSNWCGYTFDVKRHCMNKQVGVYKIGEFMAALNMKNYWECLTEFEKEKFEENDGL